jgi:C1A family cysteine protease
VSVRHRVSSHDGRRRHLSGWRPGRPDHRDKVFAGPGRFKALFLPKKVDLEPLWVQIEDQGAVGSCTSNSSTSCLEYLAKGRGLPIQELSRLFGYYASRVWIERVPADEDSGAVIRDVMKALLKYGVCLEKTWPYDPARYGVEPSAEAKSEALRHQLLAASPEDGRPGYYALPTLLAMRQVLADGYPFVGGFSVPASMMEEDTSRTGYVALPKLDEEIVGGHAVAFVGYGLPSHLGFGTKYDRLGWGFKFANSWGTGWGLRGFGFLPAKYWTRGLLSDCWVLRSVEDGR